MKIKDLKHKPQELPCCKSCEHKGKGIRFCVETEKCFDILIHNDLVDGKTGIGKQVGFYDQDVDNKNID